MASVQLAQAHPHACAIPANHLQPGAAAIAEHVGRPSHGARPNACCTCSDSPSMLVGMSTGATASQIETASNFNAAPTTPLPTRSDQYRHQHTWSTPIDCAAQCPPTLPAPYSLALAASAGHATRSMRHVQNVSRSNGQPCCWEYSWAGMPLLRHCAIHSRHVDVDILDWP
jgi:hypothetical protein